MPTNELGHSDRSVVPANWSFYERDENRFVVTDQQVNAAQNYLWVSGAEVVSNTEPKSAEYFFDDNGQAKAFRRLHSISNFTQYFILYPHSEINTYYRWKVLLDPDTNKFVVPREEESTPHIWFGRLFRDQGSTRQQEEMAKNLGSLSYRSDYLQNVSLGQLFINQNDDEKLSLGQPYLKSTRGDPTTSDNFTLTLFGSSSKAALQKEGQSEYSVLDPTGEPTFYINWWNEKGALHVQQLHLKSGFRKLIRAKHVIDTLKAANFATSIVNHEDTKFGMVNSLMEMSREIGCTLSLGGCPIKNVFED